MRRRFATLDVFTDRPLTGNGLAVVLDGRGLETAAMQAIAREFNLSETVFVFPPDQPSSRARLRIFTPARELPFAGHPTIGTAVLLGGLDGGGDRAFVLEETIGAVACRTQSRSARAGRASFDVPRLPSAVECAVSREDAARALGLEPADIGAQDLPIARWSAGNAFTFVPVRSLAAMARCTVDVAGLETVFRGRETAAAFLICPETTGADRQFHARMFAPGSGMLEDPATGSAVASFAGYLAASRRYADGSHVVRIEQGYEMGRPSLLELTITMANGALTRAAIAGDAVVVSEGELHL